MKQILKLLVGILIAALFMWLMLRHINLEELKHSFSNTNSFWVLAAIMAFFIGYACRIERWHIMLKQDNPSLTWGNCSGPLLGSFAANNILPFRAGDLLRSFAFNQQLGVSSGVVIATLFVERLLDLLMVLVILGIALALFALDVSSFVGVGSATLIALALAIMLVLLFPQLFRPLALAMAKLIARLSPNFGKKLQDEIHKSLATLSHLSKKGTMLRLLIWSSAAWIAEGSVFWCAALALRSLTAPEAAWLALPIGTLATLIPSTPGYIGTFDYFIVQAMQALDNPINPAIAYALLVHALLWLPPTLLGGSYLLLNSIKNKNHTTQK
ncbi:MAG: flippase-like domain-containing protein [Methyloprofundus sp.]|nr:flippase-like domain-containing protein [Methyloprofundus sp.]